MPPHICLNMIVRNESARIIRALDSCKGFISSFAILDTGSTDDTVDLITKWAAENGVNGIIGHGSFVNFSQARNEALSLARSWHNGPSPWFDFILLMDADMELRVDHPAGFENLTADVYSAVQKAGGMSYHNVRLVSVANSGTYIGVTHEFFNSPSHSTLGNVWFVDHADGANRGDKFERDIRLLRDDLEHDPENARSWFYLANSYRDAGYHIAAVDAYRRRIALGGWDEEVWQAQVDLALALKAQGLEDAFFKEIMAAYQLRPQRLESLHIIGKHLREKGAQATALLFIEKGLHGDRPNDHLFVQDWMYEWGFREEFSICGFYGDSVQKDRGYRVTNNLAIDKNVPEHVRQLARANMAWYLPKLDTMCPSFKASEINFRPKKGYTAMNPSVCNTPSGKLEVLLRTVNYKIDSEGRYMIGPLECNDAPIDTENWLLMIDDDLSTKDYAQVTWARPAPRFPQVTGLEDMRIWWGRGVRNFSATVREQSTTGQCEMWTGNLFKHFGRRDALIENAKRISDGISTQKNWMPVVHHPEPTFMYDMRTIYNHERDVMTPIEWPLMVENIRGSSQLITFKGGYLAVVHEAIYRGGKRVYQHRFAHFTGDLQEYRLSLPFVFEDVQIEFCAGLAPHPDGKSLVISYGVRDELAMLATVNIEEVAMIFGVYR